MTRRTAAVVSGLVLLGVALAPFLPFFADGLVPVGRDHLAHFLPKRLILAQALHGHGSLLWNPFVAAGTPFLADPQSGVLSPVLLFLFGVLPFRIAYVLSLPLHVALAGMGLASYLRSCGRSWLAATLGGVAFSVSGFVISLHDVTNNLATLAWIPVALACAARAGRERGPWRPWSAATALCLALAVAAGEPLLAAAGAPLVAGVLAHRAARSAPRGAAAGLRAAASSVACVAALAALLAAVQALPLVALTAETTRTQGLPWSLATRHSLSPAELLDVVLPGAFDVGDAGRWVGTQSFVSSLYVGWVVLVLVPFARLRRAGWGAAGWVFAAVSGLALSFGSHFPGYRFLYDHAGFDVFRYPVRLFFPVVLAIAILGAAGLDGLRARWRGGLATTVRACVAPGLGLVLLALLRSVPLAWPAPVAQRAGDALVRSLLVAAVVVVLAVAASRLRGLRTAAPALIVLVCAVDLVARPLPMMDAAPLDRLLERFSHEPAAAVPGMPPPRVLCRVPLDLRVADVEGRGGSDLERARRHQAFVPGPLAALHGLAEISRDPVLPLGSYEAFAEDLARRADPGLPAYLGAVRRIELSGRGAGSRILVADEPGRAVPLRLEDEDGAPVGETRLVSWRAHDLRVSANAPGRCRLLHLTSLVRGWTVTVDGAPAALHAATGGLQGVWIPAGRHDVRFRYRPPGLVLGAMLSTLGVAACVATWARAASSRRRGAAGGFGALAPQRPA